MVLSDQANRLLLPKDSIDDKPIPGGHANYEMEYLAKKYVYLWDV